jgi:hypothetical protein
MTYSGVRLMQLARQMIFLERCARQAEQADDPARAEYLWARRAWVCDRRSVLMRQQWAKQHQPQDVDDPAVTP